MPVREAEDRLPGLDRTHALSWAVFSTISTASVTEDVACENHPSHTSFIWKERNVSVALSLPEILCHWKFPKYTTLCNPFTSLHVEYPSLECFPLLSTWKTSHLDRVTATLKNQEVRMETWEGARSRGTVFSYIMEFLGLSSAKDGKQPKSSKSVSERGREILCHRAREILVLYIYVQHRECYISAIWSQCV